MLIIFFFDPLPLFLHQRGFLNQGTDSKGLAVGVLWGFEAGCVVRFLAFRVFFFVGLESCLVSGDLARFWFSILSPGNRTLVYLEFFIFL